MPKQNVLSTVLLLVTLVFISCEDKEGYITVDDVVLQEGFVKGRITGTTQDSSKVDEILDLYYSYFGENTIDIENDSNLNLTVEYYSSIIEQNKYRCNSDFSITVEDNIVKIQNCDIQLSRQLNENQLLELNLSKFEDLTIENFAYNSSTNKVSGQITGKLSTTSYYMGNYQAPTQFDINIEFETKVWEILR